MNSALQELFAGFGSLEQERGGFEVLAVEFGQFSGTLGEGLEAVGVDGLEHTAGLVESLSESKGLILQDLQRVRASTL